MTEPTIFGLGRIAQVALPVKDIARAVAFYRDSLGMRLLFEAPPALAFFDADGVRLMLSGPEAQGPEDADCSSIIYFAVKDMDQAQRALKARGVHFTRDPQMAARMEHHDLWLAFLEDGEGNTLALSSEVRRQG